jgi:pyruvoyl-dependent arginine decarboxylase (PvlArgDC)
LEKQIKDVEKQLNKDDVSEEYVQQLSKDMKEEESMLDKKIKTFNLDEIISSVNSHQKEVQDCNKEISETASLMKEREAEQLAAIRVKDMKDKREQVQMDLDSLVKNSNQKFEKIGIVGVDPDTIEKKLKYKIM